MVQGESADADDTRPLTRVRKSETSEAEVGKEQEEEEEEEEEEEGEEVTTTTTSTTTPFQQRRLPSSPTRPSRQSVTSWA